MELKDLLNRKILIATKHHKELVIAPILKDAFNLDSIVLSNFDTDLLGTFTGEIERKSGPLECVRQKAKLALENSDCDLVLASEGSFGPHPSIFFAPCNEEFFYLFDKKNKFELSVKLLSTNTNFSQEEITSVPDFNQFLERVKFPSHAIILKDSSNGHFFKGITELEEASKLFYKLLEKNYKVPCETDMRAMYNPSRMENIKELTQKLVDTLQITCPSCNTPGFQVIEAKSGLPCELCNFPTASTLKYIFKCLACNYEQEQLFPHNKQTENPMYCDFCNP
jgi:hypothetical protein